MKNRHIFTDNELQFLGNVFFKIKQQRLALKTVEHIGLVTDFMEVKWQKMTCGILNKISY